MSGPLTLGTAGHIDHGKSALIGRLTGVETDRLPQERQRGISIELGYASLTLPSGRRLSVIDVPGHERFVRTMVAGATGIDLFLMVVAADDGVMPQTHEHAEVLRALDVAAGVIAVTKCDIADPDAALLEVAELFPDAQAVAVSSRTGEGIEALLAALDETAEAMPSRSQAGGPARLHIDRAFTIRGAGTVLTGTLWAGSITRGDQLVLLPEGREVRVRGVQIHDEPVESADAGQRVAVNLTGVALSTVRRGDVLAGAQFDLLPTHLIDAALSFAGREPEHGARVQVHHGTREAPARLAWLGGPYWQLRLEQPLIAARDDRLVIRQIAPPDTLGGGIVLDAHPRKHGPSRELLSRLSKLAAGEALPAQAPPPAKRQATPPAPLRASALALEERLRAADTKPPPDSELDPEDLAALRATGRVVRVSKSLHYHAEALEQVRARVVAVAEAQGGAITLAQLRDALGTSRKFAQALLEHLDSEKVTIRRGEQHVLRRRM